MRVGPDDDPQLIVGQCAEQIGESLVVVLVGEPHAKVTRQATHSFDDVQVLIAGNRCDNFAQHFSQLNNFRS